MNRVRVSFKIALCLAFLSASVVLGVCALGMFPDPILITVRQRVALCEALAIHCSALAPNGQTRTLEATLREVAARNSDIRSIGLRRADGEMLAVIGNHSFHWSDGLKGRSNGSNIFVPILSREGEWGTVEVAFRPLTPPGFVGWLKAPWARFATAVVCLNALVFVAYLRRTLTQLDPSKAVPPRVRSALDTFAEGLMVLDDQGRIVLANEALADALGSTTAALEGRLAAELPLKGAENLAEAPWQRTLLKNEKCVGVAMTLAVQESERTYKVNTSPIVDPAGKSRGVFASFDDITALERKKAELLEMLDALKKSRSEIEERNKQLQYLATRDPLTGCLNRRSFFEDFDKHWAEAQQTGEPLCCVMTDIDFFKAINDNHGHSMGDEVLRQMGRMLLEAAREGDLICRFGGEEFCVLLPNTRLDEAAQFAEGLRLRAAALKFTSLQITTSLGVSCNSLEAENPQQLLDQADKCLYVAKRNGRNQVVRYDTVPKDLVVDEKKISRVKPEAKPEPQSLIPYHAVSALLSALTYRDPDTAGHSTRVADLAVSAGRELMSASDLYTLEVAALLHDIGKIGVPDAILLKPGPLTREEWQVMDLHARIGVEIVAASFRVPELVEIIRCHHAPYGGSPDNPSLPSGKDIPLGARLVTIADAYDAMVSDRIYRKGRTPEEAFAELRRTAGKQFDPDLVEQFIEMIASRNEDAGRPLPPVSREVALSLGLQTEGLARALDARDLGTLNAMAARLQATAAKGGIAAIEEKAGNLRALSDKEPDLELIIATMHELIDLCRLAQQAHVRVDTDFADLSEIRRRLAEI